MNLLTLSEAAQILKCSISKINRMRRAGKLAYLPGRPVLIDETDLLAYMEADAARVAAAQTKKEKTRWLVDENPRVWAAAAVLLRRDTPGRRSK